MTLDELIAELQHIRNDSLGYKLSPDEKGKLKVRIRICNTWINTDAVLQNCEIESKYEGLYTIYINSGLPQK